MLKLKVKPTGNLGLQEIQFYSLYVSPDLSYISGRTSYYNSILNGESVKIVNNENGFANVCTVNTENVKVQGKVKLEITLPINTITKEVLLPDSPTYTSTQISCDYVMYNGVCSYGKQGVFIIDGKLYNENSNKTVTITVYSYIEDGFVTISDKKYIANFKKGNNVPDIIEDKNSKPLVINQMVDENTKFLGVSEYSRSEWRNDTKFYIYKMESNELTVEDVLFGSYLHYVTYNNKNYYLKDLYTTDDLGNTTYVGYGVYINGNYYTNIYRQSYDGDGNVGLNDESFIGSMIEIDGDYYEISDSLVSNENGGNFVFIITHSEKLDLKQGDTIIAKSNNAIKSKLFIETDDNNKSYITYIDRRYDVKENAYSSITVSDVEYRIINENGENYNAYSVVNGNKIYYNISGSKAIPINKIYYNFGNDESIMVKYGIYENGYNVTSYSGVTIGDNMYKVFDENDGAPYIEINEDVSYNLSVYEKNGSKTYLCNPDINDEGIYLPDDINSINRYISHLIVQNKDNFTFYIRNDIFGESPVYPDTYVYDAYISSRPTTSVDKLNLSIYKINRYFNIKFPIVNDLSNDVLREDILNSYYSEDSKGKKRSDIVDMEKDMYYPTYKAGKSTYRPVLNVRFNLHFRTRQLDNWKVIEDYIEDGNREMSNWFVTDYKYYKNAINLEQNEYFDGYHTVHNASDLMGYINFTTSEIRNRAKKIGKSFLRLSFFSTDNPQTQTLLDTSTIFIDDAFLAKKIFSFQKSSDAGSFIKTQTYQITTEVSAYTSDYITADSEYDYNNDGLYNFSSTTAARLSSCLNVYDRGITNNSSEGFYFYMFKEFSNNMRPQRVYLKIDFNHAGIGRTIPFMLPRKFPQDTNSDGTLKYPDGLPLYIHNKEDLDMLKDGFKLKDIYKQQYIPIDVIYDDSTSRYVYYLPNDLRENKELNVSNDVMEFNLFEVKFKDESVPEDESNQ